MSAANIQKTMKNNENAEEADAHQSKLIFVHPYRSRLRPATRNARGVNKNKIGLSNSRVYRYRYAARSVNRQPGFRPGDLCE